MPVFENDDGTVTVVVIGGAQGVPGPRGPAGPAGGQLVRVNVTGPATVTASAGNRYVCDVTGGNIVINLPTLAADQSVAINPAAGGTNGSAYNTNTITINATSPQVLRCPAPNNNVAAKASYVIGGTNPTSGAILGQEDFAGGDLTWTNLGIGNELTNS